MRDDQHTGIAAHGSAKQTESTDPLELRGTAVPGGEPEYLARCLIEEFAGLGHGPAQILELFRQPEYLATHAYWQAVGDEAVGRLVDEVVARCGVLRVTDAHGSTDAGCASNQPEADGIPVHWVESPGKERP